MTELLSVEDGYRALRAGPARCRLPRVVIAVQGPDAAPYLQGQLSQDVAGLAVGAATWSLLLDPSGKLGSWLRVTRPAGDRFLLDVDAAASDLVVGRLNRFKLRTDAEIERAPGWWCVTGTRAGGSSPLPVDGLRVPAPWPGAGGDDVLLPWEPEAADVPFDALEIVRIEAGVPAYGAEIVEGVIPAELGQWLIDLSVDFAKGCYTGQELVARVDSRGGNVPRHLRGLVLDVPHPPPAGAEVVVGEKAVGRITSVATSPGLGAVVALAFVHRSVEPPIDATVRWGTGTTGAEIRSLPLV